VTSLTSEQTISSSSSSSSDAIAISTLTRPTESDLLIDFDQLSPPNSSNKIPKLVLQAPEHQVGDVSKMSEVTRIQVGGQSAEEARIASPQSSTTDSAIGGSTSPDETSQRQNNLADSSFSDEREENFESYGENGDVEYEADMPEYDDVDGASQNCQRSPNSSQNFVRSSRHSGNAWMRTSLRRTPAQANQSDHLVPPRRWGSFRHAATKRVGSNALASALYYNNGGVPSFNSSGRSSNCDEGDMQSDISLEEDVNDLNHKVQMLQEQVGHLAESQQTTDDRYSKVKQENATLTQKVHMLEEHIREIELQSQEKLIEEQKRHKELVQRLEREKALELENFSIKLQSAEREHASTHRDLTSLRSQVDRLKTEKGQLEQELFETQQSYSLLQSEYSKLEDNLKKTHDLLQKDRSDNAHIVEELTKEVETLREQLRRSRSEDEEHVILINNQNANKPGNSEHNKVSSSLNPESNVGSRAKEMEAELKSLRDQTRKLKEEKEDLQAQVEFSTINGGVIAGRNVLQSAASISIADELGSLSDNQEFPHLPSVEEYKEVRNALKEQQDVNASLRGYIDGILTNIIEKYPELLEISCKK